MSDARPNEQRVYCEAHGVSLVWNDGICPQCPADPWAEIGRLRVEIERLTVEIDRLRHEAYQRSIEAHRHE